jgi:hypothetical protein
VSYPVHYRPAYHPAQSRRTVVLRAFLVVPHLLLLAPFALLALVGAALAWFAIVAAGRYPAALFDLLAGYVRYAARVGAYLYLLTGRFPPLGPGEPDDGYPVWAWVDRPGRLSRLATALRLPLLVAPYVLAYLVTVAAALVAFVAWFVLVATGRLPRSFFEVLEVTQRYGVRFTAYALLLTDRFPWFQEEAGADEGYDDYGAEEGEVAGTA